MRLLDTLRLWLCISLILAISGCSDKNDDLNPIIDTGKTDEGVYKTTYESGTGYDITYRLNDNVIVIDDSNLDYLLRVEADTILYFSSSTPSEILPTKGEILSCTITDKTPYGLGNEVISLESVNGEYKCVTTTASLDEIFAELSLKLQDYELTSDYEIETNDSEGNKFYFSFANANNEDSESVSKPIKTALMSRAIESGVKFKTEIKFNVTPTFSLKLDPFHPEDNMVDFKAEFTFSGELGFSGNGKFSKPIFELPQIKFPSIAIGPIVLHPYLEGGVNFIAEAEGDFGVSFSKTVTYRAGYKNGENFHYREDNSSDDNIIRNINLDVKGSMGVEAELALGVGIFIPQASFGGKITADALFSTEFQLNNPNLFKNPPTLGFDINYAFSLFAKVEFDRIFKFKGDKQPTDNSDKKFNLGVGLEIKLPELNLMHIEWPLLPHLEDGSLKVSSNISDYTYKMRYNLKEGLLSKFFYIEAGAKVFLDDNELYHLISDMEIAHNSTSTHDFNLSNLDPDEYYKACPTLTMFGNTYEHEMIKFPEASIVGSWKYTDEEHEYYVIETFKSDGTYRYDEYDLYTDELDEWGSGTYIYSDEESLLRTFVTSGNDAPFSMWILCTVKKNLMYYEDLDDEKHRRLTYYRINPID